VARLFGLLLLAALAGLVIYAAATNQTIDVAESARAIDLELNQPAVVDGLTINVIEDSPGQAGVVMLHDDDVTGSLTLSGLSGAIGDAYRRARIDLPGFGLSDRMVEEGPRHTVAGMADIVAEVLSQKFLNPVLIVGVGLGGEVAAEVALSHPELVRGLVMVDVYFEAPTPFEVSLQRLPWMGRAATYTWETGGRLALDHWAPFCDDGGWCPDAAQIAARAGIVTLQGTTDSINAFRRTLEAALAPSNLAEITSPIAFVWSSKGVVPEEALGRIQAQVPGLTVIESATFQAHLEDPAAVASAVVAIDT